MSSFDKSPTRKKTKRKTKATAKKKKMMTMTMTMTAARATRSERAGVPGFVEVHMRSSAVPGTNRH
jgi:hypothetical protein